MLRKPVQQKESYLTSNLSGLRWGIALGCFVFGSAEPALAQSWKRVGTVSTLTNGQLCKTDGVNVICDTTTPTVSGANLGIGTTLPTQTLTVSGNIDALSNGYLTEIANAAGGTTLNKLAKFSSGSVTTATTTDKDGIAGIVVGAAGTSGNAQIAVNGQAACVFDGATTAGDYVTISASTAGDCSDAGGSRPTLTQTIGRVLTTGPAGTYAVALSLNGATSSGGVSLGTSVGTASPSISGDATTGFYTAGAGKVDVTIAGTQSAEWSSAGYNLVNANTGLLLNGGNAIRFPTSDTTNGGSLAIGSSALANQGSSAAYHNTAAGYQSMGGASLTTAAVSNAAFGYQALTAVTSASKNTAIGNQALASLTSASGYGENTAVGNQAMLSDTVGYYNVAIGAQAMQNDTNGIENVAIGVASLAGGGSENVAIGPLALNNGGNYNVAVGARNPASAGTLSSNSSGQNNVAVGNAALAYNKAGSESTAIGYDSMYYSNWSTTSFTTYNTAVGAYSLQGSTNAGSNTGTQNTAFGHSSMLVNTSGSSNAAMGYQTLTANTTGSSNVAEGVAGLAANTTGNYNTALGRSALNLNTTGSNNSVLGEAVASTTLQIGSNNILIGTDQTTDTPLSSTSNWMNIGNAIYGYNLYNATNTAGVPQIAIGTGLTSVTAGAVLDLSSNTTSANSSLALPSGTTSTRPTTGVNGMVRYNATYPAVEAFVGGSWAQLVTSGSSSAGSVSLGTSTIAANPAISGDLTSGLFTPAAASVGVTTSGTERMRITNTGMGIGVVPVNKLDVFGALAVGTSYAGVTTSTSNGAIIQGNVGIGTTSQTYAMQVYGAAPAILFQDTNTGSTGTGPGLYLDQLDGGGANTFISTQLGTINFRGKGGGVMLTAAKISSVAESSWGANFPASDLIFYTSSGTLGERMRIADGGNVGINNTGPNQRLHVGGNIDAMTFGYLTEIGNNTGTGTTVNKLAKLSVGSAVISATTDTDGMIGVVVGSAGTSVSAQIATYGQASCIFDGPTVAGDYVTISNSVAGDCKDAGATRPTASQTIGQVLTTNAAAGTFNVALALNGAVSALGSGVNLGTSLTTANPSILGDLTTGLYTSGAGKIDLTISGTQLVDWSSAGENIITANTGLLIGGVNGIRYPSSDTVGGSLAIGSGALAGQTVGTNYNNVAIGLSAMGLGTLTTGASGNSAVGSNALAHITSGKQNAAFGTSALAAITSGTFNTAVGYNALVSNTSAVSNTAVGASALSSNLSGSYNTAVGVDALEFNYAGQNNAALGYFALANNSDGVGNTGLGYNALYYDHYNSGNTAVGEFSLYSFTGPGNAGVAANTFNTALGSYALYNGATSTAGIQNTAVGAYSAYSFTTGGNNTAVGYNSLYTVTTGSSNTVLGAGVGSTGLTTGSNNILIGTDQTTTTQAVSSSNSLNIGNVIYGTSLVNNTNTGGVPLIGIGTAIPSYTLHVNGSVAGTSAYNNLSDARLKKDVVTISDGLALVGQLRGVRFNWRNADEREVGKGFKLPVGTPQVGFIAQEVERVLPEAVTVSEDGVRSMEESKLTPVLVEAVKELNLAYANDHSEIVKLQKENADLKAANDNAVKAIKEMRKEIEQIKSRAH